MWLKMDVPFQFLLDTWTIVRNVASDTTATGVDYAIRFDHRSQIVTINLSRYLRGITACMKDELTM